MRKSGVSGYEPDWVDAWSFRVNDPESPAQDIFICVADLGGLKPVPGNLSSITEYGAHDRRAIACRWNILQPLDTYWLTDDDARRVTLSYGRSSHPMQQAMKALLDGAQVRAVQTFISARAAIQSRAVFI